MRPRKFDRAALWFVSDGDYQTTPSQLYHESSKIGRFYARFEAPAEAQRVLGEFQKAIAGKYKRYDYTRKYPLPPPDPNIERCSIRNAIRRRRSCRDIVLAPLDPAALSAILALGAGLNGELHFSDGTPLPLRTYPSAGALYPLEVYPILLDVPNFPRGIFHYDVYESQLDLLRELDRQNLTEEFPGEAMLDACSAILVITAILPRLSLKYGERSYRYAHLEAGHLAQNIALVSSSLGLSMVPVGGFVDVGLESLVDADGLEEIAVYSLFIGQMRPGGEP